MGKRVQNPQKVVVVKVTKINPVQVVAVQAEVIVQSKISQTQLKSQSSFLKKLNHKVPRKRKRLNSRQIVSLHFLKILISKRLKKGKTFRSSF